MPEPFYPSDLTNAEWQIVELMLPQESQRGKHREVDFRQVVNAIFYRADSGSDIYPTRRCRLLSHSEGAWLWIDVK